MILYSSIFEKEIIAINDERLYNSKMDSSSDSRIPASMQKEEAKRGREIWGLNTPTPVANCVTYIVLRDVEE